MEWVSGAIPIVLPGLPHSAGRWICEWITRRDEGDTQGVAIQDMSGQPTLLYQPNSFDEWPFFLLNSAFR
jgi:hypothetical protein